MKRTKLISVLVSAALVVLLLAGCASTSNAGAEPVHAEADYSLVGYDYVFQLDGDTVQFKFLDIFSEEEIASMANTLMASLPAAVDYSYPCPGNITIKNAKALTEAQFDAFVESAKALIYDIIY